MERPDNLETTALGAAYAAGIGAGIWTPEWVFQHRTTARQGDQLRRTFQPQVCTSPLPLTTEAPPGCPVLSTCALLPVRVCRSLLHVGTPGVRAQSLWQLYLALNILWVQASEDAEAAPTQRSVWEQPRMTLGSGHLIPAMLHDVARSLADVDHALG